uniref:(northern house mosquito) hypothetical protein n=1 Tax=Culex pipiens TaxID=7175 RepID=A0A8D8AHV6_CULPI
MRPVLLRTDRGPPPKGSVVRVHSQQYSDRPCHDGDPRPAGGHRQAERQLRGNPRDPALLAHFPRGHDQPIKAQQPNRRGKNFPRDRQRFPHDTNAGPAGAGPRQAHAQNRRPSHAAQESQHRRRPRKRRPWRRPKLRPRLPHRPVQEAPTPRKTRKVVHQNGRRSRRNARPTPPQTSVGLLHSQVPGPHPGLRRNVPLKSLRSGSSVRRTQSRPKPGKSSRAGL